MIGYRPNRIVVVPAYATSGNCLRFRVGIDGIVTLENIATNTSTNTINAFVKYRV